MILQGKKGKFILLSFFQRISGEDFCRKTGSEIEKV